MAKIDFNFNSDQLSIESIDEQYRCSKNAIDLYFSKDNPDFHILFGLNTKDEITDKKISLLKELDFQASLAVLTIIEAKFRIDFIIRCKTRLRDKLTKSFRIYYNPMKRLYHYGFKDVLLDQWKDYRPNLGELFDRISDAMNFRNWLAHGRYWEFADNINKFKFDDTRFLYDYIIQNIGNELYKYEEIGVDNKIKVHH